MLRRQLIPLFIAFARHLPIYGRTRMQKLVFLVDKKASTGWYNFKPHWYGPYSRELYHDLDDLVARELLKERIELDARGLVQYSYEISEKGKQQVLKSLRNDSNLQKVYSVAKKTRSGYSFKTLDELLAIIYEQYPEYARRSLLV